MRVGATGRQTLPDRSPKNRQDTQGTLGGTVQTNRGPTIRVGTQKPLEANAGLQTAHKPGGGETLRHRIIEIGL
jgi:hypothetical protein